MKIPMIYVKVIKNVGHYVGLHRRYIVNYAQLIAFTAKYWANYMVTCITQN